MQKISKDLLSELIDKHVAVYLITLSPAELRLPPYFCLYTQESHIGELDSAPPGIK